MKKGIEIISKDLLYLLFGRQKYWSFVSIQPNTPCLFAWIEKVAQL